MSQQLFTKSFFDCHSHSEPVWESLRHNSLLSQFVTDYEQLIAERNFLNKELKQTLKEISDLKKSLASSKVLSTKLEHQVIVSLQAKYHELESVLEEAQTKTSSLIQAIPDLIFRINSQGYFLDYYPDKHDTHPITSSELINQHLEDVFPKDLAEWTYYYVQQTLETGEIQLGEYVWKRDENWLHYEARYVPSGENEVLAIVRDITIRKQAEAKLRISEIQERERAEQLEKTLKELQQAQTQLIQAEKMSSLGRMMTEIAHEIKNPINSIYGNLNYVTQDMQALLAVLQLYQQHYPEPSPEIQQFIQTHDINTLAQELPQSLEFMKLGANRLYELALSLRNFSRLDTQEMIPADLHIGLDGTLKILHNQLKTKGNYAEITVIKEYGQLPLVKCYPNQLSQVFMNLLSNAIDALEQQPEPRTIRIKTEYCKIRIETALVDSVRICISDNGAGIPESVQEQIFNAFFTTKPIGKGTGLGLPISHQIIVEKHKGQLLFASEIGKGTTFEIILPQFEDSDS